MIAAISGLLSSIKQTSPVILIGLAVASGVVLYGSDEFLITIGLNEFKEVNKSYIGSCFVLSVSIVFAYAITAIWRFIKAIGIKFQKSRRNKKLMRARKDDLINLTPDEKNYLAPYIFNEETTQYFSMEDGVKGSLEGKKILYLASNMGDMIHGFAYNIHPWARKHLKLNPELLQ